MIIPLEEYENSTELKLSSSVVTVVKDNMVSILALNLNDHSITFPKSKQVAVFQFLSPQEEEKLIESGPEVLALDKMKNGEILNQINELYVLEITEELGNKSVHCLNKTKFGSLPQKHVRIQKTYLHFRGKFSITFLNYNNVNHSIRTLTKKIQKHF